MVVMNVLMIMMLTDGYGVGHDDGAGSHSYGDGSDGNGEK